MRTAKNYLLCCAGILATFYPTVAWCNEPVPSQPVGGKIDWLFDYAEGKRLSESTGKPLWVVFRCER